MNKMISKEELYDLYYNKKYTILKISKILNLKKRSISLYIKKYDLQKGPTKHIKIEKVIEAIPKNILYKEYFINLKSCNIIAKEYGFSNKAIYKLLKKYNINTKLGNTPTNLIGKKIGHLTVQKLSNKKNKHNSVWTCLCDCGKTIDIISSNLMSGETNSCGCYRSGSKHYMWKGYEEISGGHFNGIKQRALDNKIEFSISIEYIWQVFLDQDRKCKLSGISLYLGPGKKRNASLDRIDSSKGYTKENVQWVHKDINKMKQNLKEEYFIRMCEYVTKHNQ
jgi:hypothetical protein